MNKTLASIVVAALAVAYAAPAGAQSGYGRSVAVNDGEVFVGESGNVVSSGFVYVYRPTSEGWKEVARLAASDAGDGDAFGRSLGIDGDRMVVGGGTTDGRVYIFERRGDEWTEVGRVSGADSAADDGFGGAVAMSGDNLIVGAAMHNERQGAAYIFARGADGWSQVAKLEASDPPAEESDAAGGARAQAAEVAGAAGQGGGRGGRGGRNLPPMFGSTVAISGDWALVGAPNHARRAGSVYVFQRHESAWQQVAQLPGDNAQAGAGFGASIALGGDEMLIGAPGANGGIGGVAVYRRIDEGWAAAANLAPFDAPRGGGFGSSIVLDGTAVLIGAPGAANREGRIYRYQRDAGGNWTDATKLGVAALNAGDRFATVMAAAGDIVVAGVPGDDFGAGTAIIMARADFGWNTEKVLSDIASYPMVTGVDGGIACSGGMASSFPCDNVDLVAYLPVHEIGGVRGLSTNDAWGWTDAETSRDYAIVGMRDRTSFVDVTDPYNPAHVGVLMKTEGSNASSWRDMKVRGNWVYIVSDNAGEHGMQIFNLERLRDFAGAPIDFEEDHRYTGLGSSHNIVINPDTDWAYAVGTNGPGGCGGGLHIINIEDPANPTFEGCFQDMNTGRRGTGGTHDAMCITYAGPDERYSGHELCFGSNETALSIADVSDKRNPVAVAMATYPNVAYSHQGWITDDHKYFFMNDELDEGRGLVSGTRTLIWDVQDLEDPILVKEYVADNPATDHNLYIKGDVMYQSNYDSGLRVFDISDPENPEPIGFFDTVPYQEGGGMTGSWSNYPFFNSGIVVVTSGREGLLIVKVRQ